MILEGLQNLRIFAGNRIEYWMKDIISSVCCYSWVETAHDFEQNCFDVLFVIWKLLKQFPIELINLSIFYDAMLHNKA